MKFKKYFEKQYEMNKEEHLVDGINIETLKKLRGESLYSPYQVGDVWLTFFAVEYKGNDKDESEVSLSLETVVERELELMEKEYEFVDMHNAIPAFKKLQ